MDINTNYYYRAVVCCKQYFLSNSCNYKLYNFSYKMVQGEFIFYFLIYMLSLFFKDFSILRFLIFLVIRAIQILIVWYDDTFYVYYEVKEEKEV